MKKPFTTEQFFTVFEKYNSEVFPSQLIIFLLTLIILFSLHSRNSFKDKAIGFYLAFLWFWTGIVYHIAFFTTINKAAFIFGGISVIQGALILISTFSKDRLTFSFNSGTKTHFGYFFILFALVIYPLVSYLSERIFIRTITLGLPCPSTILTFGFFMLTHDRFPKFLLIIPSLWAIVGLSAAINFGIYQDFMMIIAAVTSNLFLLRRKPDLFKASELKEKYGSTGTTSRS